MDPRGKNGDGAYSVDLDLTRNYYLALSSVKLIRNQKILALEILPDYKRFLTKIVNVNLADLMPIGYSTYIISHWHIRNHPT